MRHDPLMSAADPYARTIRQAAHDAVLALLTAAPDSVGRVGRAARRGGLAGARARSGCGAGSRRGVGRRPAEALEAIAAVEQRDAVEVADRWFHDQPAPDVAGAAADPGQSDSGG